MADLMSMLGEDGGGELDDAMRRRIVKQAVKRRLVKKAIAKKAVKRRIAKKAVKRRVAKKALALHAPSRPKWRPISSIRKPW